jgi:hypothetical protein
MANDKLGALNYTNSPTYESLAISYMQCNYKNVYTFSSLYNE